VTPAESLLPGHLLASAGSGGRLLAIALLLAAVAAVLVSLIVRPPRDVDSAALRLAICLAAMFTLGPNERFGYFIYPLGLLGWLALTTSKPILAPAAVRFRRLAPVATDAVRVAPYAGVLEEEAMPPGVRVEMRSTFFQPLGDEAITGISNRLTGRVGRPARAPGKARRRAAPGRSRRGPGQQG
jgi:hypothetical protein